MLFRQMVNVDIFPKKKVVWIGIYFCANSVTTVEVLLSINLLEKWKKRRENYTAGGYRKDNE